MFQALRGGVNPAPEVTWQAERFKVRETVRSRAATSPWLYPEQSPGLEARILQEREAKAIHGPEASFHRY
jgi:hypothetical protein